MILLVRRQLCHLRNARCRPLEVELTRAALTLMITPDHLSILIVPKKNDYDPCEGTIGKGKTNAELADIAKKNIESSVYWRDLDAFITIFESTHAALRVNDGDVPP